MSKKTPMNKRELFMAKVIVVLVGCALGAAVGALRGLPYGGVISMVIFFMTWYAMGRLDGLRSERFKEPQTVDSSKTTIEFSGGYSPDGVVDAIKAGSHRIEGSKR